MRYIWITKVSNLCKCALCAVHLCIFNLPTLLKFYSNWLKTFHTRICIENYITYTFLLIFYRFYILFYHYFKMCYTKTYTQREELLCNWELHRRNKLCYGLLHCQYHLQRIYQELKKCSFIYLHSSFMPHMHLFNTFRSKEVMLTKYWNDWLPRVLTSGMIWIK